MSISTFVALRYMKSSRENRFFSWITVLSVAGIALGIAAMIVVLSVINGFEDELRSRFLAANAPVMAHNFPAGLIAPQKWINRIQKDFPDELTGMVPFINYESMARKGSLSHSVLVRGIIPAERETVRSLRSIVRPVSALSILDQEVASARRMQPPPPSSSVILGRGLVSLLGVQPGDQIQLVPPTEGSFGSLRSFTLVGIYDSGLKQYDDKLVIMSLTAAQNFFQMGATVTGLEIGLRRPQDSIEIAAQMAEKYPSLHFVEWQSLNRPLFEAMKMQRAVIALIVAIVAFVAGFNILTTLFVSVNQKQRDICILKSLGARNTQIVSLFLKQGTLIGFVGAVVGVSLAYLIASALKRHQFIDLPDVYLLASLPVSFDWKVYLGVATSGVLICIFAGLYPALVATRLNPIEGIRGNADRD